MNATTARVSTEELRLELEGVLSRHFATKRQIRRLRRRLSNYSSSYTIETLEVELDHGKRLSLVFKDMSAGSLLEEAKHVRPDFLYSPIREIETYRELLDPKQLGTAICYGTTQQPERERYWLFLERVNGPLLWQVGRIESWKLAARWLARLHSCFRGRGGRRPPHMPACLLRYDERYYQCWIERAGCFLSQRRDALWRELREQFECLTRQYEHVVSRLICLPQTLIHGEFYPSNVILRDDGLTKHVCPVDWEAAALGPGVIDLAALTSGNWTAEQKQSLLEAYHAALAPDQEWSPSTQELAALVDYCQLHLAVQWLGWARNWTPPKNHAQDWLRQAVDLAQRLGITAPPHAPARRGV